MASLLLLALRCVARLQTAFAGTVDDHMIAYTPDYGCVLAKVWTEGAPSFVEEEQEAHS